jgi:hypothetical protein
MSVTKKLVSGLVIALGLAAASEAQAQEILITGPLAGAPAVRKMRQYREGRFELAPTASFTLLDEYRRSIMFGLRLQYNIKEWLAIGVWGADGLISSTTDLADQVDQQAVRNSRTATQVNHTASGAPAPFANQLGKMSWVLAAPQVTFIPFRGKLAIFQKIFVDTDLYFHAAPAFVGLQERADCGASGQPSCTDPASFNLASRTAITGTFGLGLTFYTSDLFSFGIEYRALPFAWNRSGFDSAGATTGKFPDNKIDANDRSFKFNQMITLAFGFGIPTHPHVSE